MLNLKLNEFLGLLNEIVAELKLIRALLEEWQPPSLRTDITNYDNMTVSNRLGGFVSTGIIYERDEDDE